MRQKHTPGPWEVEAYREYGIEHYVIHTVLPQDLEANARLITAAPEMLEALKVLTAFTENEFMQSREDVGKILKIVWAAIAKAEGRE